MDARCGSGDAQGARTTRRTTSSMSAPFRGSVRRSMSRVEARWTRAIPSPPSLLSSTSTRKQHGEPPAARTTAARLFDSMLYLTHLYPASARSGTVRPAPGALAFIGHTSLDILALPTEDAEDRPGASAQVEPFSKLSTLPLHARIMQALTLRSVPGAIILLTDHPAPRLVVLVPDPASKQHNALTPTAFTTHTVVQLQDSVRHPAELGMGMCMDDFGGMDASVTPLIFTHTYTGSARIVPLPIDALIRPPSAQSGIGALAGFDVRLPHQTLIQSTFLDSRNFDAGSPPPLVALLSLSSTPTTLPGLGPQCLPVLSFHWIDLEKQELTPCPWGPAPALGSPSSTDNLSKATAPQSDADPAASGRRRSSRIASSPAGNARLQTYGPSAKGADRSAAAIIARDKKLAAQDSTRAHVPLPYIEALGAHLLLALPARAGGGVLVFSETCILYVPPPASAAGHSAASFDTPEGDIEGHLASRGAESHRNPSKGKRRKASDAGSEDFTAASSTSPHEASSTMNEHGKRRRASGAKTGASRDIIRTAFRKPVNVAAAIVQVEPPSLSGAPNEEDGVNEIGTDGRAAALRVLFATQAGTLHSLTLSLTADGLRSDDRRVYAPVSMHVSKIGSVPRPGSGSGGLLYLGDGFLQIASMVGDSVVVRIDPVFGPARSSEGPSSSVAGQDDWENEDSATHTGESLPASTGVQEFRRFPNLAPILDFVIDHGPEASATHRLDSGASSSSSAANVATRLVTCSGTGPSGSLRSVKIGAELNERGSISLGSQAAPASIFKLALSGFDQSMVLLSYPERTEMFLQSSIDNTIQWDAVTDASLAAEPTIAAASLDGNEGLFVVVTSSSIRVFALLDGTPRIRAQLDQPEQRLLAAAADSSGRIVTVDSSRTLNLLQVQRQGPASFILEQSSSRTVEDSVSSVHVQTLRDSKLGDVSVASVAYFTQRAIRLFHLPSLEDVTPDILSMQSFVALPTCVLIHALGAGTLYLFLGCADGSVISFRLSRLDIDDPIGDAGPVRLGVADRRTVSLGLTPVRSLVPLRTTRNVEGVLAAGEKPVLLYESNERLNYSALTFGALGAASATLPPHPLPSDLLLLRNGASSSAGREAQAGAAASLHILQVGDDKKAEIETLPLGHDNPIGITLGTKDGKSSYGVITRRYLPEGEGAILNAKGKAERGKGTRGKVIVIDRETFDAVDTFELEAGENPHCIEFVTLGSRSFFVVGTGWDNPMESETLSGRIIGLELVPSRWKSGDREIAVAFSQKVRGGVNAVVGTQGHLVAAINSSVVLYRTKPSKSALRELSLHRVDAWGCAYFATSLVAPEAEPDRIIVNDAMRSMVVLKLDVEEGTLSEIARECDPSWLSAVEQLSHVSQHYVGADVSFNLFTSARTLVTPAVRRKKEALARQDGTDLEGNRREADPGERSSNTEPPLEREFTHVIKRRGGFHLGDMVNRFRKGALLHADGLGVLGDTVRPNLVFCTAGGALGLLADVSHRTGTLLAGLVHAIDDEVSPLGRISVREWRAFRSDHRELAAAGFVDGDELVDKFLSFDEETRGAVVRRWKREMDEEGEDVEEVGEDALLDAVTGLARLV